MDGMCTLCKNSKTSTSAPLMMSIDTVGAILNLERIIYTLRSVAASLISWFVVVSCFILTIAILFLSQAYPFLESESILIIS